MKEPEVRITEDREGKLLAVWANPPGLDAEFHEEELRQLAMSLLEAAQELNEETPQALAKAELNGAILKLADMSSKGYSAGSLLKQLRYVEKFIMTYELPRRQERPWRLPDHQPATTPRALFRVVLRLRGRAEVRGVRRDFIFM